MGLANAILAYAMAGALVLWLIGEDRQEEEGSSRVLRLVSLTIVAVLLVGEDREYGWWISGFVVVVLGALGVAVALGLLGALIIPGRPP